MPRPRLMRSALTAVLALPSLFLAGCDTPTGEEGPKPPVTIELSSGSSQSAEVGALLSDTIKVRLLDASNRPVSNHSVSWSSPEGSGSPRPSTSQTDASGYAHTSWTLGTTPGEHTLTASTEEGLSAVFTAIAVVGPPSSFRTVKGSGQSAAVGETLPSEIVFELQDKYDNPISDSAVQWSAPSGLVEGEARTDSSARVSGRWTLGTTAGLQTLSITAGSSSTVRGEVTATAGAAEPANLSKLEGDNQSATVGTVLPTPLALLVQDEYGNAVPGSIVSWALLGGVGSVDSLTTMTDSTGHAYNRWTMGTRAGVQSLTVSVDDLSVEFASTALAGPAASLTLHSGDNQTGREHGMLAEPIRVHVLDLYSNNVPGVFVSWSVSSGEGTVSADSSSTDTTGVASVNWTVGDQDLPQELTASIDTLSIVFTAEVERCDSTFPDSDSDRLPDCMESGSNVYNGPYDPGTDPNDPDTDGDGMRDGDEVLGTVGGLDLPGFGVNPLRKDILMEYDWFDDSLPDTTGTSHSHRPRATITAMLDEMFASAPINNPDGSTGINIIHDYGQGGVFTGGNLVPHETGILSGGVGGTEYRSIKAYNFASNREYYFHYVLMPHQYGDKDNYSSGQAYIWGWDMIVSLANSHHVDYAVANTIAHELGHNLGLWHGGLDNVNYKPNYNSVMNYEFQFRGVDTDCRRDEYGIIGDGVLNFSLGLHPALNESNLDESAGICGSGPGWDWNEDGDTTDSSLAYDINNEDGYYDILRDYNDWDNLWFVDWSTSGGASMMLRTEPEIVTCDDVPHIER